MENAPDFCWMSSYDLMIMAELEFPDIENNNFKVQLCALAKEGFFKVKRADKTETQLRLNEDVAYVSGKRKAPSFLYLRDNNVASQP